MNIEIYGKTRYNKDSLLESRSYFLLYITQKIPAFLLCQLYFGVCDKMLGAVAIPVIRY